MYDRMLEQTNWYFSWKEYMYSCSGVFLVPSRVGGSPTQSDKNEEKNK